MTAQPFLFGVEQECLTVPSVLKSDVWTGFFETLRTRNPSLPGPTGLFLPPWAGEVMDLWAETIAAWEGDDRDWLAARFDPWIKHRLIADHPVREGRCWREIPGDPRLRACLALLDQGYHTFTGDPGLFPPEGLHPFPRTPADPLAGSRAGVRAAFLRENGGTPGLVVDWKGVYDNRNRWRSLADPFSTDFGSWRARPPQ